MDISCSINQKNFSKEQFYKAYLHALLTHYIPPRCLRSSSTGLLAEPRCRTVMGSRAFHASAPKEWNRLPLSLRSSNSLPSFKKRVKTHYFSLAFKDLEI